MCVEVTLSGLLAARTGTSRTYVSIPEEATLSDVVESLSERYGAGVRPAIVEGAELRSNASVVRQGNVAAEELSLDDSVDPGDRLDFRVGDRIGHCESAREFSA